MSIINTAEIGKLKKNKLDLAGGTLTGNLSLGDSDKAIFGAGSDLQIYHDGSHSYIKDLGTGELRIRGSNVLRLQTADAQDILYGTTNGQTFIFYDNSIKLATTSTGIDVTGTVTADGLTVNSTSAQNVILRDDDAFSGADNQIKLAIAPSVSDGDSAGIAFGTYSNNDYWKQGIFWQRSGSYGVGDLIFANRESVDTTTVSDADQRLRIASNGDISFYEDTGTTAKFFWDASAERLGIGTTSPSDMLHVNGNGKFNNIAFGGYLSPYGDDTYINMLGSGRIQFRTNGSERMRIDSSGNMGLGVTPESWQSNITAFDLPSGGLSAYSTSHTYLSNNAYNDSSWKYKNTAHASLLTMVNGAYTFDVASSGTAGATIASTGGWTTAMTIDNSGNVGIGTSSPYGNLQVDSNPTQRNGVYPIMVLRNDSDAASTTPEAGIHFGAIYEDGGSTVTDLAHISGGKQNATSGNYSGVLKFYTRTSGDANVTERMRIDSAGRVTMPSQPVFDVTTTSTSMTGTIVHNTTYVDVGGNHNTTNGRFTAPVDGTYYFYTSFIKNAHSHVARRYFQKNGSTIHGGRHLRLDSGQNYGDNGTLVATIYLSAHEYITVYQGAGTSHGETSYDYFGGHLIG